MKKKFKDCEYEVTEITKPGDDSRIWHYKGRNLKNQKEFDYKIQITKSALGSKSLPVQIQEAVHTQGESLVKIWLSEGKGYWVKAAVSTKKIDIMEKEQKYGKFID
jgi:hypothetical protein